MATRWLLTREKCASHYKRERFNFLGIPLHFSNDDVNDLFVNTVSDVVSLQIHM